MWSIWQTQRLWVLLRSISGKGLSTATSGSLNQARLLIGGPFECLPHSSNAVPQPHAALPSKNNRRLEAPSPNGLSGWSTTTNVQHHKRERWGGAVETRLFLGNEGGRVLLQLLRSALLVEAWSEAMLNILRKTCKSLRQEAKHNNYHSRDQCKQHRIPQCTLLTIHNLLHRWQDNGKEGDPAKRGELTKLL